MKKYLKTLSLLFILISCSYLPSVNAASSTQMLITIAETNPALLERLNAVALDDAEQLNQLLKMAESKPEQLERLLNIAETDLNTFLQLITIRKTGGLEASFTGIIDDSGGVIRN